MYISDIRSEVVEIAKSRRIPVSLIAGSLVEYIFCTKKGEVYVQLTLNFLKQDFVIRFPPLVTGVILFPALSARCTIFPCWEKFVYFTLKLPLASCIMCDCCDWLVRVSLVLVCA